MNLRMILMIKPNKSQTKFLCILGNPKSLLSATQNDDSSAIRRACSLSDLSMGKGNDRVSLYFFLGFSVIHFIKSEYCFNHKLSFIKNKGFKGSSSSNSNPSNYKPLPNSRQNTPSRSPPKRTNSTVGKTTSSALSVSGSGMGTRSISVGTLNQAAVSRNFFCPQKCFLYRNIAERL